MSIAKRTDRQETLTWALSIAALVLGWLAYSDLPRLEYRDIPVREARIVTPYPGASAGEVEQEVSDKIEMAAKELGQARRVESYSSRGLSVVSVSIRDEVAQDGLPRVWDELRRKITELQPELPPEAGPAIVDDHLGDVYGVYYALVGDGFTPAELTQVAELLQRALSNLEGVKKVILFGVQQETIFVEVSRAKSKDVDMAEIISALRNKNLPADAGHVRVGPEYVAIHPERLYRSEQELGDLMLSGDGDRLIRLGDISEIHRDYEDPPQRLLRVDGRPAVGIAISTHAGRDPAATGNSIKQRLAELHSDIPLGMELKVIADQSQAIAETSQDYGMRLMLAMGVVLLALLLVMGPRAGLLVGFVTLLTMAGTFLVMDWLQIPLERISRGALLIALGLAPANTILFLDDMKTHMARQPVGVAVDQEMLARRALPLLAATVATILAFIPIWDMSDNSGEYSRGLFLVVVTTLSLSWVVSVGMAPFLADRLRPYIPSSPEQKDPYDGPLHRVYGRILTAATRRRWLVLGATSMLIALSWYGFGLVGQIRFPLSAEPSFLVEVYFREGTHIRVTEQRMDEIQDFLNSQEGITQVTTAIGGDHPRYSPIYSSGPTAGGNYAVSVVSVDDPRRIDAMETRVQAHLEAMFPGAAIGVRRHLQGPETSGGRIRLKISGPDPAELRRKAHLAERAIGTDPDATAIRDDWGAKVKVADLLPAQATAHRLRIDRSQIAAALRTTYTGTTTGVFREDSKLIPIVVRASKGDRSKVEDMADVLVTSPLRGDRIGMSKLEDRLETRTEDARRIRRDALPTITVHADADRGSTSELLGRIKLKVEKVLGADLAAHTGNDLGLNYAIRPGGILGVPDDRTRLTGKPGYFIAWGGEAESTAESRAELWSWIPICFGLTALALIALFNDLRQPSLVLLSAPLAVIGVIAGLLLAGQPFDFLSLLAVVGLSGLSMRIAVLLLYRIDEEIRAGKPRLTAILDGARSRLRPLVLATGISVLAILPLLPDQLFTAMAVTLISGLGIATLLILLVVPVLYAVLLGVRKDETS